MKRIRKAKQKETVENFKSHFFDTKEKVIGLCAAGVILLALVIALMFVESGYGKLVVKNNTDIDLENVAISYVNAETVLLDGIETGAVSANSTYSNDLAQANLLYSDANLEVHFTFAGYDEMLTDVGYFADNFNGNIKITFTKTDDPNLIKLRIKASNGLFKTKTVDCDEVFTLNLSEGRLYE